MRWLTAAGDPLASVLFTLPVDELDDGGVFGGVGDGEGQGHAEIARLLECAAARPADPDR